MPKRKFGRPGAGTLNDMECTGLHLCTFFLSFKVLGKKKRIVPVLL